MTLTPDPATSPWGDHGQASYLTPCQVPVTAPSPAWGDFTAVLALVFGVYCYFDFAPELERRRDVLGLVFHWV